LKREEKLWEQIFARNRSWEIVNLYLDWIVYETKGEHRCDFDGGNANRLLALSGAGNGDDSGGIHGLRLSFHWFDIRNDVSARVAL
jgi:hypothetical protein